MCLDVQLLLVRHSSFQCLYFVRGLASGTKFCDIYSPQYISNLSVKHAALLLFDWCLVPCTVGSSILHFLQLVADLCTSHG